MKQTMPRTRLGNAVISEAWSGADVRADLLEHEVEALEAQCAQDEGDEQGDQRPDGHPVGGVIDIIRDCGGGLSHDCP